MTSSERLAWLRQRQTGLGATDVASLAGVGFLSPIEVYRSKVEAVEVKPVHPLLRLGLATEDLNAALYAEAMGVELSSPGLVRSSEPSWAYSTLDRQSDDRVVELKYTPFFSDEWGDPLTDEVPMGYICQTHWQMMTTGLERADISVLSGTGEHRIYRMEHDHALASSLLRIAREFWERFVLTTTEPPEAWVSEFQAPLKDQLAKIALGSTIELTDDTDQLCGEYHELGKIAKTAEDRRKEVKQSILDRMGEVETARAGNYKLTRKLIPGGHTVNYVAPSHVRLNIKDTKGKR